MMRHATRTRSRFTYRLLSAFIAFTFSFTTIAPPGYAQLLPQTILNLPVPGTMVTPSAAFVPVLLKGMTIHPENPLQFDFIIDSGNTDFKEEQIKAESERLVKYFLASMTIPKDDLWVNLSPYESDKIIPEELGKTELGRDMLAQDYILKQLTASLMYPEKELGKEFWSKVYQKAQEKYGTTEIPVDTFNKVWILPETATVYEHGQTVYIVEAKLKVMLDADYIASGQSSVASGQKNLNTEHLPLNTEIIREIILPEIEKEVNEGQNFAPLRQIYHSLILAKWYKETIKNSLLSKIYVDQKKTAGVESGDETLKDQIYAQYMEAYKKGVFNYIKEDYDRLSNETIPRKYFSGGLRGDVEIDRTNSRSGIEGSAVGENYQLAMEVSPQKDGASSPIFPITLSGARSVLDNYNAHKADKVIKSIRMVVNSGKSNEEDIVRLIKLLEDQRLLYVRRMAIDALLAELKDKRAIEPLMKILKEEGVWDPGILTVLVRLGASRDLLFEGLIKDLSNPNKMIALRAVEALGTWGDEHAVEPLTEILKNTQSGWEHIKTLNALARLGVSRNVLLDGLLNSNTPAVATLLKKMKDTIHNYLYNYSSLQEVVKALSKLGEKRYAELFEIAEDRLRNAASGHEELISDYDKIEAFEYTWRGENFVAEYEPGEFDKEEFDRHNTAAEPENPSDYYSDPSISLRRLGSYYEEEQSSSPATIFDEKISITPQGLPERRDFDASQYDDLYTALADLYQKQAKAGRQDQAGTWKSFFKIIEYGNTVGYALFYPHQNEAALFSKEIPQQEWEKADIVFVQNVARAARPARPGKEKRQVDPHDPKMEILVPSNVIKNQPDELYLQWTGPSGHPWWLTFNPFAIWPQKENAAANDQPFHMTVSRADGRVYQKEMNDTENIKDVIALFAEMNSAARLRGAEAFRVAVNGWYYSDAPDAPKAGASQSQAHAQILRFIFPIEHAKLQRKGRAGAVQISTIADGLGTGIVLEAPQGNEADLAGLTAQALSLITGKGHSFNILVAPGEVGTLRVFIADKVKGTPEPYFTNEWAFAEFGRAIVVDDPATFYKLSLEQKQQYDSFDTSTADGKFGMMRWTEQEKKANRLTDINPILRENALAALKIVTAPQEEIDAIVQVLSGQSAEAETLLRFFENDENKLRAEIKKWTSEYKEEMGVSVSDAQILKEEFFRLTDENGRYDGRIMPRNLAHAKKQWHRTVGAFVIDRQGNVLFQKRAADKATKPGAYDVSAGGHAGLEDPRTAVAREIEEEIFDSKHSIDLSRLFPLTADNEFVRNEEGQENASFFVYVLEEDEKEKVAKQGKDEKDEKDEVDALWWLGAEALDNLLQGYKGYAQDSDDPYAAGFLFFENETRKETLLDLTRRLRDGESIQEASSPIVLARDIESAEELIVQKKYEEALKIYKEAQAAVGTLSKKEVKKDDEEAEKKGEKIIRYLRELKEDIDERITGLELAIAFEKNELTQERIQGLSSYQMVALLRILPLAEFSIPQKFILYSGAPGSGKGTLMEQTFDKKARFADIVGQLLLYHTRPARKGELDGKKYHFRLISVLKTLEQIGRIKRTAVNKQQQGVADEEFEEEVVVRPNVPSEALLRGDIVIRQGDTDLSEEKQWVVEDKKMAVKEETVVKRKIKGVKEAFGNDKITVMEGGYGWFLVLTKDPWYADIFTVFITPFEDDEIVLRGKNQEIISATFARPFDRFIAYSLMNIMRLERGKEKLDLEDPETLGDLRGKVEQWLQMWGARESSPEMMRSLKRHETDEKPALKNNAVLIESDEFIEQINRSLKKYFGKADADLIKTDQQKALVRALAYEVQMKVAGDVARGDTSFYLEIPTEQSEETGVFTRPEDMFNRVVEGVIQIMFRKDYYTGARAGKGLVVRNKFVYNKDQIKTQIEKMADDFSAAYFTYLLTAMAKEKGERDRISSPMTEQGQRPRDKDQGTASDEPGGIDMNTIDLDRQGAGVEIQFDPAQLQEIIDLGIDGLAPVIINITPLPSVLPLLGLDPVNKEEEQGELVNAG